MKGRQAEDADEDEDEAERKVACKLDLTRSKKLH